MRRCETVGSHLRVRLLTPRSTGCIEQDTGSAQIPEPTRFRRRKHVQASTKPGRFCQAGARGARLLEAHRRLSKSCRRRSGEDPGSRSSMARSRPTTRWASITPGAGPTRTSSSATGPCAATTSAGRTALTARACGSRSRSRRNRASRPSGTSRPMAWPSSSTCASSGCWNTRPSRPQQSIRLGYWMDWNDPAVLRELKAKMAEDPTQVITVEGPKGPVTDTVEQIVGRLGLPELGGSYFTFSNENNYTIWTALKKCHDHGWIYKGTRRDALVRPLRHRHQPARDRHRGLPGADPPQRLPPLSRCGTAPARTCWSGPPRPGP